MNSKITKIALAVLLIGFLINIFIFSKIPIINKPIPIGYQSFNEKKEELVTTQNLYQKQLLKNSKSIVEKSKIENDILQMKKSLSDMDKQKQELMEQLKILPKDKQIPSLIIHLEQKAVQNHIAIHIDLDDASNNVEEKNKEKIPLGNSLYSKIQVTAVGEYLNIIKYLRSIEDMDLIEVKNIVIEKKDKESKLKIDLYFLTDEPVN